MQCVPSLIQNPLPLSLNIFELCVCVLCNCKLLSLLLICQHRLLHPSLMWFRDLDSPSSSINSRFISHYPSMPYKHSPPSPPAVNPRVIILPWVPERAMLQTHTHTMWQLDYESDIKSVKKIKTCTSLHQYEGLQPFLIKLSVMFLLEE